MFRIQANNFEKKDLLMELIDEFLPKSAYEIADSFDGISDGDILISVNKDGRSDLNSIKRELYMALSEYVSEAPDWGILTGVRPVKLAGELYEKAGRGGAEQTLKGDYLISAEKTDLVLDIYEHQIASCGRPDNKSLSLYIGIPFCPQTALITYTFFCTAQILPTHQAVSL